jgi:hypothetical protein
MARRGMGGSRARVPRDPQGFRGPASWRPTSTSPQLPTWGSGGCPGRRPAESDPRVARSRGGERHAGGDECRYRLPQSAPGSPGRRRNQHHHAVGAADGCGQDHRPLEPEGGGGMKPVAREPGGAHPGRRQGGGRAGQARTRGSSLLRLGARGRAGRPRLIAKASIAKPTFTATAGNRVLDAPIAGIEKKADGRVPPGRSQGVRAVEPRHAIAHLIVPRSQNRIGASTRSASGEKLTKSLPQRSVLNLVLYFHSKCGSRLDKLPIPLSLFPLRDANPDPDHRVASARRSAICRRTNPRRAAC